MKELEESRRHLNKFFNSVNQTESIGYLSKAIDCLEKVILEDSTEENKKVAGNIYENLIKQIFERVEIILKDKSVELEIVEYWKNILEMFGIERADLTEKGKQIFAKWAEIFTRGFTIEEIENLIKR